MSGLPRFPRLALALMIVIAAIFILTNLRLTSAQTTVAGPQGDGLWQDVDEASLRVAAARRLVLPLRYRSVRLNLAAFEALRAQAPRELSSDAAARAVILPLPLPDGGSSRFRIEESPIMEPSLAAQYPEIKTYLGRGIDDPTATLRADWTPQGFHAQVLAAAGAYYIDPYARGDREHYLSYYRRDFQKEGEFFRCFVTEQPAPRLAPRPGLGAPMVTNAGTLHTYRLAVAATGEYTTFHGGTVALALAAINTTMNRVNGIFEREVGVRLILVGAENTIIYTNAGTDPYTNGDPGTMTGENQTNLDATIMSANYDIGHVFGTNSGGLVQGRVCNNPDKARGVTGSGAPIGDPFDIDYVAHEMGHQFSANHTFNDGTNGSCADAGQRIAGAAYEPGSASTIMGYAGICGAADLQRNSDPYFHVKSLEEIIAFISGGGGSTCDATVATGNTAPTINAGADFTIPRNTPFTLTATGSDPDGEAVTFGWEEYDLGTASPPETDDGSRPIFRSFNPTASPSRTFPSLTYILNNANVPPATYTCAALTCLTGEQLPSTNRTMNFQVTARDNRAGGGGVNSDTMQVTVIAAAGPFAVTSPNTALIWPIGTTRTVTWNVAGTTAAPISTANVRILLSLDGGITFPITLAASTPNDGSENILVPNNPSTTARVRVEAVGNIYFDISDANFTIRAEADLAATKTDAPDPVVAGHTITYTISFVNNGPSAATGVSVIDTIPIGTTLVSSSVTAGAGWAIANSASGVTFTKGTVIDDETAVFSITVRVCAEVACNTILTNTVNATSATFDPVPGNNIGAATTTVEAQADLAITKAGTPDPVPASTNVTYTLIATNLGPSNSVNTVVTDLLPRGFTIVSLATTQGTISAAPPDPITLQVTVTANLGTLGATAQCATAVPTSATITIVARVPPKYPTVSVVNAARVTGGNCLSDPNPSNNEAVFTTSVVPLSNDPGLPIPAATSLSDDIAGSVLIFNLITSSVTRAAAENTRISLTNIAGRDTAYIHLFFVDGATCSVADHFICLTPNQTHSFLASDFDPGTQGYLIAVATDETGQPAAFNCLLGDAYVKLASGHAANLAAEAVTALRFAPAGLDPSAISARLDFDGVSYNYLPRELSESSIFSIGDQNSPLLVVNRIGGDLRTSADRLALISGLVYDDAEQPHSFASEVHACQLRRILSDSFPRTTPRLTAIIPAMRAGWMRFRGGDDEAITGAAINYNPEATTSPSAFNQGHNLHHLSLLRVASLTIPIFPPGCGG